MSRLAKKIIVIDDGVKVESQNSILIFEGPKGRLEMEINPSVKIDIKGNELTFPESSTQSKELKTILGSTAALVKNNIKGVKSGFDIALELVGIGYRVQLQGSTLKLSLGYSHEVNYDAPDGITFSVEGNNQVVVSGIDKQLVGQTSAELTKLRAPDAYKGKGVRYKGVLYRLKPGKSVKK